jgi:DNA polymerase/3'-5' exonuclease PolX
MKHKISLDDAIKIVNTLPNYLLPTGSIIRKEKMIGDIDLLTKKNLEDVIKEFPLLIKKILKKGEKYLSIRLMNDVNIDIWRIDPKNHVFEFISRDYPKYINIALRKAFQKLDLKLNNEGVFNINGEKLPINNVKDVFKIANIRYREPWDD